MDEEVGVRFLVRFLEVPVGLDLLEPDFLEKLAGISLAQWEHVQMKLRAIRERVTEPGEAIVDFVVYDSFTEARQVVAFVLRAEAPLVLYGPFHVGGSPTSDSNARFDESLQRRDPSWGVRDREDVIAEAVGVGLRFVEAIAMPANNQCLVFERAR